jgi:hypothetical protein
MQSFIEQSFECVTSDEKGVTCRVVLSIPERDGNDFKCVAEIQGAFARKPFVTIGGDPFQALLLAVASLTHWLQLQEAKGAQFYLLNGATKGNKYSIGLWSAAFMTADRGR